MLTIAASAAADDRHGADVHPEEHPYLVDHDHLEVLVEAHVGDRLELPGRDPGVVDEDIETAERGLRDLDRRPPAFLAAHVELDEPGPLAELGDELLALVHQDVADDDGAAFGDDAPGVCRAHPAPAPETSATFPSNLLTNSPPRRSSLRPWSVHGSSEFRQLPFAGRTWPPMKSAATAEDTANTFSPARVPCQETERAR